MKYGAIIVALALAVLSLPAMAESGCIVSPEKVNFGSMSNLAPLQITSNPNLNFDLVSIGSQKSTAIGSSGWSCHFPFFCGHSPTADNKIDIQKSQTSSSVTGQNKINFEAIGIGDQSATSIGTGRALNEICISTTQD